MSEPELPAPTSLDVTVVVPVRNGGESLPVLIADLRAQTLTRDRFEVVIADDGSTDGSAAALEPEEGWLRVTRAPAQTSYAARNRGAALGQGSVLAFCDADCRPRPDWLERGLTALAHAEVAAGAVVNMAPRRRTVWALLDAEGSLDQRAAVTAGRAMTANLFVRRELFERLGGFDATLPSGGDFDFVERCVAQGGRLVHAPDAVVLHPTPHDARSFLRKVWFRDRWASTRARPRVNERALGYLALVPVAGPLWARRRRGRPLGLDRARLEAAGIDVRLPDHLRAGAVLYLFLPYFAAAAQLRGAVARRRARRSPHRRNRRIRFAGRGLER